MRAADIRKGVLKGKKLPVVIFLSAMLNLWAHHDSGEAADGADQRPADLPVPSESHPTGGASPLDAPRPSGSPSRGPAQAAAQR